MLDYINFSMKQIEQIYISEMEKYICILERHVMYRYTIKFKNTSFANV